MKDKNLKLLIKKYDLISAVHWYVIGIRGEIRRKCNRYKDARKHALKIAYARNITVHD